MKKNEFKLCQVKDVSAKAEGVISFILTKRMVDRDSEVIEPRGLRLDDFKKNPVFLWAHDMWETPPIGKILTDTLMVTEDEVTADVKFDMEDPFAKLIYNKYVNGFMNAGSIRFRAVGYDKEPVLPGQKGWTITKWDLYEFSAVPVPANPGALAKDIDIKSIDDERAKKWYERVKEFTDDDNFDNTPDGWVDFLNKAEDKPEDEEDEVLITEKEPTKTESVEDKVKDYIEDIMIQFMNHGALPFRSFAKADDNHQFEYHKAIERVRSWASSDDSGDEDKIEWSKFKKAFAWMDPRKPKSIESYKLLHHDVIDGELKTVYRGAADSMIRLLGAKGSVEIPEKEKISVYNHLCRHYEEFEKKVPDYKNYTNDEIEEMNEVEISPEDIAAIVEAVKEEMAKKKD